MIAFHFPNGQEDANDLVLKPKLQPHSPQQGCVPGAKHLLPAESRDGHSLQIPHLNAASASICSFLKMLFLIPSRICGVLLNAPQNFSSPISVLEL